MPRPLRKKHEIITKNEAEPCAITIQTAILFYHRSKRFSRATPGFFLAPRAIC
jgi:hypothetical protein